MSFSNQLAHVKNEIVETRKLGLYGQVRKIAEDRFVAVDGGLAGAATEESGIGADETGVSGISAMQTYPARRAMYSQSTTAKYASVTRNTPIITSRQGAIWMKASGTDTSVVATLKATRCAKPCPCAHGKNWSGSFSKKSDGGRERAQRVLTVADREHAGEREQPVQGRPRDADQSSQRKKKSENQAGPWV